MKKLFLIFFVLLIGVIGIIAFNTLTFHSRQYGKNDLRRVFDKDTAAISRLTGAIHIQTISYDNDSLTDYTQFDSLIAFLRSSYPLTFSTLNPRIINKYSLLLHWKGKAPGKKPVILYAHTDVVPAGENAESTWTHPAFEGVLDENFIYGRGAIDDKGSVISILESTERLLKNKFIPQRDIYIAFGHDEEASGEKGAAKMAEVLKKENVNAEFILDEGGLLAIDMVPFVKQPVALVFTSEKGYMTLELKVRSKGGHSGFPPTDPPIEILSKAIRSIGENPFPVKMTTSVAEFMDYAGPEMSMPYKALFANKWLFSPIIFKEYEKIPSANAMIRTTAVATVIHGGEKENVIPSEVTAKINFRLLPGDSSAIVYRKVKELINDERVEVKISGKVSEASAVSSAETEGFQLLKMTISKIFPDAVTAPSLLIAMTDSRHFRDIAANIYRFQPVRMDDRTLGSMHGTDEKIGIAEFMEMIAFYEELIKNL